MFQTKVVEKIVIHILYSITFFENHAIYDIMWKNTLEWGRPQHCMLHTQDYKYTQRLCIIYCFFHCNNGCTNVLQCYVIHTLPVFSLPHLSTLQTLMYSYLILVSPLTLLVG